MTDQQNDLLRLLDITPTNEAETLDEILSFDSEWDDDGELTETVLVQDEWDVHKAELLNKQHKLSPSNEVVADFHSMLYQAWPTRTDGQCISKRRQQFIETMMESSEYNELHQSTMHNLLTSEMATIRIARQFAELVEKGKQNPPQPGTPQPDGNMLQAVGKGLAEAQEEVDEVEEMHKALGDAAGLGPGGDGQSDMDKIKAAFQRIRNSKRLKDIFDKAGAYRRAAKAIQQSKSKHGYDDMVGVELGGDVSRLLANELALIDDEDLELDVMRRIIENQAMCREYEGVEKKSQGPVVVVVDESGSMSGDKIANAKALALAMAWIAKHQKRWCALVGFSGGTEGVRCVLKPGKSNETELLEWLDHFYSGGTTMDVPLHKLPTTYWQEMQAPKGKTDVIVITDAQVRAPSEMVTKFNEWREREQVRCISIILGHSAGDLTKVSNITHCLPNLSVESEAVTSCLNI